jgi:hypothetical protein
MENTKQVLKSLGIIFGSTGLILGWVLLNIWIAHLVIGNEWYAEPIGFAFSLIIGIVLFAMGCDLANHLYWKKKEQ